jgi:hypothetical protein
MLCFRFVGFSPCGRAPGSLTNDGCPIPLDFLVRGRYRPPNATAAYQSWEESSSPLDDTAGGSRRMREQSLLPLRGTR